LQGAIFIVIEEFEDLLRNIGVSTKRIFHHTPMAYNRQLLLLTSMYYAPAPLAHTH